MSVFLHQSLKFIHFLSQWSRLERNIILNVETKQSFGNSMHGRRVPLMRMSNNSMNEIRKVGGGRHWSNKQEKTKQFALTWGSQIWGAGGLTWLVNWKNKEYFHTFVLASFLCKGRCNIKSKMNRPLTYRKRKAGDVKSKPWRSLSCCWVYT